MNEEKMKVAEATLRTLNENRSNLKSSVDKLGVVLEELVKKLDLDGSGVDVYLLHYIADARQSLRSTVELLDSDFINCGNIK